MGRDSRIAMVRLGTDSRDFDRGLRSAEKSAQTWGNRVKGHISKSLKDGFGGLQGIAGLAGIAGFGALAREVKLFNDRLVRLQIQSGKSRGEMLKFNQALQDAASATGASQDQLLAGAERYQELTGRFGEFQAALGTFAKVHVATGTSMEALATSAAALASNLHLKPEEFLDAFGVLSQQGKAGAIQLNNVADALTGVTAQFALFNTTGPQGVRELGAWFQTLRKGAPDVAETTTMLEGLMHGIRQHSAKLKHFGIDIWANKAKGELKDLAVIVDQIVAKVPLSELGKISERKEFQNAIITYRAHREEFEQYKTTAGSAADITKDFATEAESAGGKMAIAEAHFKATFNAAIMKNLDAMVLAFDALVKALSWMAQHPEALAGLAFLWKGGGFLGTIAGLAPGAGGAGGLPALGAGAASATSGVGAARYMGIAGAAAQRAAVGYVAATALGLDKLDTGIITATSALSALPGPIGGVAGAMTLLATGIVAAAQYFMGEIEKEQKEIASQKYGDQSGEQNADILLGKQYLDPLTGEMKTIGPSKSSEHDKRIAARATLREIYEGGGGVNLPGGLVSFDSTKAEAIIRRNHPKWSDEQVARAMEKVRASRDLENNGPAGPRNDFVADVTGVSTSGGPMVFGAGGLSPGGGLGDWQSQATTPDSAYTPTPSFASQAAGVLLIKVEAAEGVTITAPRKVRMKGGR